MPNGHEAGETIQLELDVPREMKNAVRACILRVIKVETPELDLGGPVGVLQEHYQTVVATITTQFPELEVANVDGRHVIRKKESIVQTLEEAAGDREDDTRDLYRRDWAGLRKKTGQARRLARQANKARESPYKIKFETTSFAYKFTYRGEKIGIIDMSTGAVLTPGKLLAWANGIDAEKRQR